MRWLVALPLLLTVAACAAKPPQPVQTAAAPQPAPVVAPPAPVDTAPGQRFPVFFAPASATLHHHGRSVVSSAAAFAQEHPTDKVTLVAYAAPPGRHHVEPDNIDTQRAAAVTAQLVADGVEQTRIGAFAKGPVAPGAPMSKIEVRRVDIIVGTPPDGQ